MNGYGNEQLYTKEIEKLKKSNVCMRKIHVHNREIHVLFVAEITDRQRVSEEIIKPILQYRDNQTLNTELIAHSVIFIDEISIEDDPSKLIDYVLKGFSVILVGDEDKYIAANTVKIEKRNVNIPEVENTLRGPKDAFTENIDTNLSLIQYRIKDPTLHIERSTVGRRTRTEVAVIYIEDIANPDLISQVQKRLAQIDVDGIISSGELQKFLTDNNFDLFPQIGIVERSDRACASILEGRVCIVVEGSNLALVAPKALIEFMDSSDDHYDNLFTGILTKLIRSMALFITFALSSLYVAVVSFHSDILPAHYILVLATGRATVPFNAFTEALGMELISEILREASTRLPKLIGPAIGIVGTIVIGQAAVAAGLVSPLMVIIVALSTMSSFVAPEYTIMNSIRILKFFMIIFTGIYGLFGFVMGITLIIVQLLSRTSFGVPYLAPIAPFNFQDIKNYILTDIVLMKKRPNYLRTRDKTRK